MNIKEVSIYLGVSDYSIHKYMRSGYLPYQKTTHKGHRYYFRMDDVHRFKITHRDELIGTVTRRPNIAPRLTPKDKCFWRDCPCCGDPMFYSKSVCTACKKGGAVLRA